MARDRVALLLSNNSDAFGEAAEAGLTSLHYLVARHVPSCWRQEDATDPSLVDAVVLCGGLRSNLGEAARFYAGHGVPVAMLDLPYLRIPGYMRVSGARHDWLPVFTGSGDAPVDRLPRLRVEPRRRREFGSSILLVGQVSGDSAHGMDGAEFRSWAMRTLNFIRAVSQEPVTWRPHPLDPWALSGVDAVSDPKVPFVKAIEQARVVVTYNSTVGLEALVHGVPVVAEGPAVYSSMAYKLNEWSRITAPKVAEVRRLLAVVSYTQWTREEIATGVPLGSVLEGVPFAGGDRAPRAKMGEVVPLGAEQLARRQGRGRAH